MVSFFEKVGEFIATGFIHSGEIPTGLVLKSVEHGNFVIDVSRTVVGVSPPGSMFNDAEEAKKALFEFWKQCDNQIQKDGSPKWIDVL